VPAAWRVIGRGFTAETAASPEPLPPEDAADEPPLPTEDAEAAPQPDLKRELDRTSRYNFDELGRILADRVGGGPPQTPPDVPEPARAGAPPARTGELINLAGETFILNRLPLGILVFRDQQVLFANRALTELTGHESIESLRSAGLTSIFPAEDAAISGPVTHLVRRDGQPLPVNARLQSIAWHGRAALMLSASLTESRPAHEAAVKGFAELAAEVREEGFIATDRDGVVTQVSLHGRIILGRDEVDLVGQPLSLLLGSAAQAELRSFLERPARFAETARPGAVLGGVAPGVEIVLFAEGQAGIVTGYFGFIHRREDAPMPMAAPPRDEGIDAEMLGRFSRGVRRPLNTVIGFADLIRSAAFGPIDIPRYLEYAGDILAAGQEIAGLMDEIDDLSQLSGGTFATRSDALDLVALLDTAAMRVRAQAAARRVLVRSAVSERLPRVRADRASLTQAILNLLASAVDQSPPGGTVILSAQPNEEGGLTVNVRDSAAMRGDTDERFVVFREAGASGQAPVRSSVGLALTRSLLKVNALTLTIDPVIGVGTLFSLTIPAELTVAE
jgi:signal transduction histidine kinase